MLIDHRTEIEKLTFRALALRQSERRRANARNVSSQSLYGGQFTLSTMLINQIFLTLTDLLVFGF